MLRWTARVSLIMLSLIILPFNVYADDLPLQINVVKPPIPVKASDSLLLQYELHVVNPSPLTYRLGRLDVYDETNEKLATYSGTKLEHYSKILKQNKVLDGKTLDIPSGGDAFIYVWVPLDKTSDAPTKLRHELWVMNPNADKRLVKPTLLNYETLVNEQAPLVLGAPLAGSNWLAHNALGVDSAHRFETLSADNNYYSPNRYAVDWLQICPNGSATHSETAGTLDVLSASDGTVSQIKDNQSAITSYKDDSLGNYIVIKANQGDKTFYVSYAHLQPNSLKVKIGDTVKEGQVIASIADNATLHLQVNDNGDVTKSEGVPFVLRETSLQGKAQIIDAEYGYWKPFTADNQKMKNIAPLANQVFYFDATPLKCNG